MNKKKWGALILSALLLISAKFTDDVIKIGSGGVDSQLILSKEGAIKYNSSTSRFQFSTDGSTFKDFGVGVASGQTVYFAYINGNDRTGSPPLGTPSIISQALLTGPGTWISNVERTSGLSQGHYKISFNDGVFEKEPLCWFQSVWNGRESLGFIDLQAPVDIFPNGKTQIFLRQVHVGQPTNTAYGPFFIWCQDRP